MNTDVRRGNVSRFVTLALALSMLACSVALAAGSKEIAPTRILPAPGDRGVERGQYAERSVTVALEVDRGGARLVAYSVKERPFVAPLERPAPKASRFGGAVQLEVVLQGPAGGRFTQRIDTRGLCLEHDPDAEPHIQGDTFLLHRDTVLIRVPEIPGFDRMNLAYYTDNAGLAGPVRRPLGEASLDSSLLMQGGTAGGSRNIEVQPASPSDPPAEPQGTGGATVIWPEDVSDPDIVDLIHGSADEYDRRINVVIVPDGYRHAEKWLMQSHATQLVNALRVKTPLKEHDAFFNYMLVYAYSVDSGTDQCDCSAAQCSCDPIVDTAMGTFFPDNGPCGSSSNRCLTYGQNTCDANGLDNITAAELRAPARDYTVIMVNTDRYGGCAGGRALYAAGNASGTAVAGHEIAHMIATVADEYGGSGCGTIAGEINTSTDAVDGAWPEWIAELGPPEEGAQYHDECVYRPEATCAMRSSSAPFCHVCNQRWALRIFAHDSVSPTAPVESVSPDTCLRVDPGSTVPFSVATRFATGTGVTNDLVWKLDGVQVASGTTNHSQFFENVGDYLLTCEVTADTNFVKSPPGPTRDVITWEITAVVSLPIDCNGNDVPDACEPDCNENGQPDDCEGLPDCDSDGLPDVCEPDCNENGQPDDCEGLPDCDGNGVPDECQPPGSTCSDGVFCNGVEVCGASGCESGPPPCAAGEACVEPERACLPPCPTLSCCAGDPADECAPDSPPQCTTIDTGVFKCAVDSSTSLKCAPGTVVIENCECTDGASCPSQNQSYYCSNGSGGAPDCDQDGVDDACEEDCDGDGTPDQCQVAPDCDRDGLMDACEEDCDANGVPDDCEKLPDCDKDGVPDACEEDCDGNGVPDDCETPPDCDGDGVPDGCEIDCNDNGTPDDCEPGPYCASGEVCSPVLGECLSLCPPSSSCGPTGECWKAFPPDCTYANTGLEQCSVDYQGLEIFTCDLPGETIRTATCACSGLPGYMCANSKKHFFCD